MLILKNYIDFFSKKPQARKSSSVELDSFVFNDTTGISMNCVVSDLHLLWYRHVFQNCLVENKLEECHSSSV